MIKKNILNVLNKVRIVSQVKRNRKAVHFGTRPGNIFFNQDLCQFLDCEIDWLVKTAYEYSECPSAWRLLSGLGSSSRKTDGLAKSLDVAEGFALWALVKKLRPKVVVELGVQYGISSRLWKEALKSYVPNHQFIMCDLEDQRKFIEDDECIFIQGDAFQTLPKILRNYAVDLIHNDVHPYRLIRFSVEEGLRYSVKAFTFHDIGRKERGPFRLSSKNLSYDEKSYHETDYGTYGHWERHVIAELFGDKVLKDDAVNTDEFVFQSFDSLFGFGVVIKK